MKKMPLVSRSSAEGSAPPFLIKCFSSASLRRRGKRDFSSKTACGQTKAAIRLLCRQSATLCCFDFKRESLIDKLSFRRIRGYSQRVEAFTIEVLSGSRWKQIYSGTVIGFSKIARFRPILTQKLKITITACRKEPYLRTIQVFESDGTEVKNAQNALAAQKGGRAQLSVVYLCGKS